MKNKSIQIVTLFSLAFLLMPLFGTAQNNTYAKWDNDGLLLDNGIVSRYISISDNQLSSTSLKIPSVDNNFLNDQPEAKEFSFTIDDKLLTGLSGWEISDIKSCVDGKGNGAEVTLIGHNLSISIKYILYPELPVIRKKMKFRNRSGQEVKLENLDIESFDISWSSIYTEAYSNYMRYRKIGHFAGNWDDALIALQDKRSMQGILLGNEAPGVLKRTSCFSDYLSVGIGLTADNQAYPFRVWLQPEEEWESPWTFIIPYKGKNPQQAAEGPLDDFVREHMGIRLANLTRKPQFVYNTWNPFRKKINEKLILELTDAADACGADEFVVDDGWQNNRGDWKVDLNKFPNGLKPVFDHIKSKGMKPGLWFSLASVSKDSEAYKNHPEWSVRDTQGNPVNLHGSNPNEVTMCMSSGWKEYIKNVILRHVKENGLEYVKLDLAIVTSAYIFDRSRSGCHAENHDHKDREESLLEIYRHTWDLFDELHAAAPDLFIDCTFETMGTLQMVDFDMCKHAEGNWLSNFEENAPRGSYQIRHMGWWRSGIIPATALVIGNQTLDDPNWELSFMSLMGTLPIMMGDPRKTSTEDQQKMKACSLLIDNIQKKYNYLMFRQDLPGFGEPAYGRWDGWSRINTKTKQGGIVGIFKQGSHEIRRNVSLTGLAPDKTYAIKSGPYSKLIAEMTGREIAERGFPVKINDDYGARIFSVEVVN